MRTSLRFNRCGIAAAAAWFGMAGATALLSAGCGRSADAPAPPEPAAAGAASSEATVDLVPSQLNAIKIEAVGTYPFSVEKPAVGSIDYDEDLSVQVFAPYQGRIVSALANLGDDVEKGQALYTIASPDLVQAESALIAAAATYELTSKELARAQDLSGNNGVAHRELEQATSDARTAEGAFKAARTTLRIFGKTDPEIDRIVATRQTDSALVVRSPVTGRITARNAQSGLFVQPGNAPAPYAVAALSVKWMLVNVSENDSPLVRKGQPVAATVAAYPGRVFPGRISALGTAVDPNTHRLMLRCEIPDPQDELRPGMLASFAIRVQDPVESAALPMSGVVRNGDGTMAAWVTVDRRRFSQRIIQIGLQADGRDQVLAGLQPGELAVTDGAVFLSNLLYAPPTD
jgi:membrane fusion protein, heavy metal efflux system